MLFWKFIMFLGIINLFLFWEVVGGIYLGILVFYCFYLFYDIEFYISKEMWYLYL